MLEAAAFQMFGNIEDRKQNDPDVLQRGPAQNVTRVRFETALQRNLTNLSRAIGISPFMRPPVSGKREGIVFCKVGRDLWRSVSAKIFGASAEYERAVCHASGD